MYLRICSKCGVKKLLSDFYFRRKGPRKGKYYEKCKECMKVRGRSYYNLNKTRQLALANLRRNNYKRLMRLYINRIKNKPCMDCLKRYPPYVMDFDHRDRSKKDIDVGRMINGGWSKNKVDNEIKKCDIVCANCHRKRTYQKPAEIAKVVKALV